MPLCISLLTLTYYLFLPSPSNFYNYYCFANVEVEIHECSVASRSCAKELGILKQVSQTQTP